MAQKGPGQMKQDEPPGGHGNQLPGVLKTLLTKAMSPGLRDMVADSGDPILHTSELLNSLEEAPFCNAPPAAQTSPYAGCSGRSVQTVTIVEFMTTAEFRC